MRYELNENEMNNDMTAAAEAFKLGRRAQMTNRELELARAWFQARRNSTQVGRINAELRDRIAKAVASDSK